MKSQIVLNKETAELGLKEVESLIISMISEKYIKDESEKTLQDVLNRIANVIYTEGIKRGYDKEQLKIAENMILDGYFIPGGSILARLGANNKNSSMSNCYAIPIYRDSIENIFDTCKKMARTYSKRGGCGTCLTPLRPKNAVVNNSAKTSTGSVSFLPLFSQTTKTIGQAGRKGALLVSLDVRHPDLLDFIWAKADQARVFPIDPLDPDLPSVSRANISVKITDEFMKQVTEDSKKPWICKFPIISDDIFTYELEYYYYAFDKDEDDQFIGKKVLLPVNIKTNKVIKPEIFYTDVGRPDVHKSNCTLNEWTEKYQDLDKYEFKWIKITKENRHEILTHNYEYKIAITYKEFYNEHWHGDYEAYEALGGQFQEYTTYRAIVTEENKYRFMGQKLITSKNYSTYDDYFIELKNKEIIDETFKNNTHPLNKEYVFEIPTAKQILQNIAEASCIKGDPGILFADHINNWSYGTYSAPHMRYHTNNPCVIGSTTILTIHGEIPIEELEGKLVTIWNGYEWSNVVVQCTGINQEVWEVTFSNGSKVIMTPYHKLLLKDNTRKELKDCNVCDALMWWSSPKGAHCDSIIISTIIKLKEKADKVYCFTEPERGTGIFNGVLLCNCSEIALPLGTEDMPGGNCLLGAHVISKYVENIKIDFNKSKSVSAKFNMSKWHKHTKAAVVLMDVISDINNTLHPLEEQNKADKYSRRLGIEFLGLTDAVSMMGYEYGSVDFNNFIDEIMYIKAYNELYMSCELAKTLGPCEVLNPEINKEYVLNILKSPYLENLFKKFKDINNWTFKLESSLKDDIETYGLRNIGLNTVGPTGSLALLCDNSSSGIEPVFSLCQKRRTRIGDKHEYTLVHAPLIKMIMNNEKAKEKLINEGYTLSELKQYFNFIEAHEIDYKKRIITQSIVQKYTDGAISSTVNLPSTTTPEEICDIYIYAWEIGLKGLTVYKAGTYKNEVITKIDNEEKNKKEIDLPVNEIILLYKYYDKDEINDMIECPKCNKRLFIITIDKRNRICLNCTNTLSKDELNDQEKEKTSHELNVLLHNENINYEHNVASHILELNEIEECKRYKVKYNGKNTYVTVTERDGEPIEIFFSLSKDMGMKDDIFDTENYMKNLSLFEALCRLISLCLRAKLPLTLVIKQLDKAAYSVNDAYSIIVRVLKKYLYKNDKLLKEELQNLSIEDLELNEYTEICPSCKKKAYLRQGACTICLLCSYTKCD